jgi:hypothetical protein
MLVFLVYLMNIGIRDSEIGIAAGYGLEGRVAGVRVPAGARIFYSPRPPDRFYGPSSLLPYGYRDYFSGAKRPGCEADH